MEAEAEEDHQPGSPRDDEGDAGTGLLARLPECLQDRADALQTGLYAACVVAFAWVLESRRCRVAAMLAALAVLLLMQHSNVWPLSSWHGDNDEDLSGEAQEGEDGHGAPPEEGEAEQAEDCDEPDFADDALQLSQDDGHSADGLGGHDDLSWQAILATARQEAEGPGGQPGGPAPDVVDLAAGEAAPDKAAGQSPDPMSKARLDLLVRYMASVEARGQDQGTTPQRQKLQRKLLLRMCGGGSEKGLPSAAPKAAIAAAAATAVVAAAGPPHAEAELQAPGRQAAGAARGEAAGGAGGTPTAEASEALLSEDLSEERMEELLRELGESEAPASAKAAGHRVKGRAGPKRAPRWRDRAAGRVATSSKAPSTAAASAESPAESPERPAPCSAAGAQPRAAEDGAEEDDEDEEAAAFDADKQGGLPADFEARPPGGDFEVVANRRARRKNRRGQAEPAGPAPAAAGRQAEDAAAAASRAGAEKPGGREAQDGGRAPPPRAAEAAAPGARRAAPPPEPRTPPAAPEEDLQGDSREASASGSPSGGPAKEPVTPERRRWADDLDEEEDDWEWQCPSGFRLEPFTCSGDTVCSSCGKVQRNGSFAMRSSESGWTACEECVNLAWDQPVSSEAQALHGAEPGPGGRGGAEDEALDPSRMSALEIAEWFKRRGPGAEDALRQCMLQVAAADDDFD